MQLLPKRFTNTDCLGEYGKVFCELSHIFELTGIRYDTTTMRTFLFFIVTLLFLSCEIKSQKMTPEEYLKIGQFIWKTYVPMSGQAVRFQQRFRRTEY